MDLSWLTSEHPRPLRRVEFEALAREGYFEDERLELLYGMVVPMTPIGPMHSFVLNRLTKHFVMGVGDRAIVHVGGAIAASDISEPQPDLAILPLGDYRNENASRALLVIEVADSSLRRHRELKSRLYSEMGVPEYWIVDVKAQAVEVRRGPQGDGYAHQQRLTSGKLAPEGFPDVAVDVAELFA